LPSPICLRKKVILLEQEADGVRSRALALFAGRARSELGLSEACVLITTDRKLRDLNLRHRRKNKATDVLSFPSSTPGFAGDIAISAEIAARNAVELGHSVETELKILILHGLLHLAGYDHESDEGEMHVREAALRARFRLPLGLIERTHASPQARRRRRL